MLIREDAYKARQRAVLLSHFDANETVFLERELTQLRAKLYEVLFPMPIARTLLPKATDIAPSASTYVYKVLRPIGEAKVINYKAKDIPRVDEVATEVTGKVVPVAASYAWDINELREAARLNINLTDMKAKTARDAIERGLDKLTAFGSIPDEAGALPDIGLTGLVNNPLVEAQTILDSSVWWLDPTPGFTPDKVLGDLNALVASVRVGSSNVFSANTVLLPIAHFTYAEQTPYSTLMGDSILTVFRKNNPGVNVVPWYRLDGAGAGGKPRAVAYQKDSSTGEVVIPQEFEVMPPEQQGLELVQNCHARGGGTKIYQPLAFRYLDFTVS